MKTHPIRTRFCSQIVAEVLIPEKQTGKVVLLLGGMPGMPDKPGVMKFFTSQGFVSIVPRFRGTWESEGEFLRDDPVRDVFDIVDEITNKNFNGVYDSFSDKKHKIRASKIYVVGASFGGTGAVLASMHPKIKKVVALAPVLDWSYESPTEPFSLLEKIVPYAFGSAYRYKKNALRKLYENKIYSPLKDTNKCMGKKILILHSKDDAVVSIDPLYSFIRDTGALFVELKRSGHLGLNDTRKKRLSKNILEFLG